MNNTIEIASPTPDSVGLTDAIAAAELECFGINAWSRASVEEFLQNEYSHVVAAYKNGVLIGYAGVFVLFGEAELTNIAVLPSERRQGAAKGMLTELISRSRELGAELLHLEVRESNVPAIALYESFGFHVDGRRKNYYSSPREDALLMTLTL